jgi:hypothetical protein
VACCAAARATAKSSLPDDAGTQRRVRIEAQSVEPVATPARLDGRARSSSEIYGGDQWLTDALPVVIRCPYHRAAFRLGDLTHCGSVTRIQAVFTSKDILARTAWRASTVRRSACLAEKERASGEKRWRRLSVTRMRWQGSTYKFPIEWEELQR